MKHFFITLMLLVSIIYPETCCAQQQSDHNQVSIRAFYSNYAVISDINDYDKYLDEFKSLLDKYASDSFKKKVIDELENPKSPAEDFVTGNWGIDLSSLSYLKIEKKGPSLYLVRYPLYDFDTKKNMEIGFYVKLDNHGKIQSVDGSYTKEIITPSDLDRQHKK